jgi:hypothetical protein
MRAATHTKILKAKDLIAEGLTVTRALKKVGMNYSTWSKYHASVTEDTGTTDTTTAPRTMTEDDEADLIAYAVITTERLTPQNKVTILRELWT